MTTTSDQTRLVDADARDTIRGDLDTTLIVEAAAGTGKTSEMIKRIITVLRTGKTPLSRVVAMTFTEKAAGEMKLRLRTDLEEARRSTTGEEQKRLEQALAELETARIGTIHSFCSDLLRERPIEAKIDPIFEVAAEEQAERLYLQTFDRWLQREIAAPSEGVRRILRRESPSDILRSAGRSAIDRRDFDGAWRRDPFDRHAAIDNVLVELGTLSGLAGRAARADDALARIFGRVERWLAELVRREHVADGVRDYDGLEAELADVKRWWEWDYNGKGTIYGDGLTRADLITRRDEVMAVLVKLLADCNADLAACLHGELRPLVSAYEDELADHGCLDFLDLLARTRDLLRDDPRVRAEMQQRFTHYFVDEFQDTDPLQVEILMLLCADNPAEANAATVRVVPGKLFVVGDPKQAIYRFRRADISLYESVKQRLLADGAQLLHLTTSFRSVPAIQRAINSAFAKIMTGGHQAQYVPLQRSREDSKTQPAVIALPAPKPYGKRSSPSNYAVEESYPDAVGAFIDHLVHSGWTVAEKGLDGAFTQVPIAPRHICLVFRRFQSFKKDLTRPYVRALEARGVPHVLVGGRSFHEREEIGAVRNALRAIEWPDDEMSVYATLRGPFFSFTDEDLLAFRHAHRRLHPIVWRDLERPDLPPHPPGSPAELTAIAGALSILGNLHRRRNRRSISDTLGRLLAETRAHAGVAFWPAGEQALANVFRVMDIARRYESAGATSFRAFIERLDDDAERGKQPEAPVVEEGTEGTRIMTVHAAKGLEFPIVILCDPCAPLTSDKPSRYIDTARRVWLEPLAGCVPSELREHEQEVIDRDREEVERLAYVAVTRAKDMLVVPVVGDEPLEGTWLEALTDVVYPADNMKRTPRRAPNCPPFGDDSVVERSRFSNRMPYDSVAPGLHAPRLGTHEVVWWDPHALKLAKDLAGGLREQQILEADKESGRDIESEAHHAAWVTTRRLALANASVPTLVSQKVTLAAKSLPPSQDPRVTIDETPIDRRARPGGIRFGSLVHAALAAVDLRGDAAHIEQITRSQARLLDPPEAEVVAAIAAVRAALAHPLLQAAAASRSLRREVPVSLDRPTGMIEGIVDLAFESAPGTWIVVDFKTDTELAASRNVYIAQVQLYAMAIAAATHGTATGVLLVV